VHGYRESERDGIATIELRSRDGVVAEVAPGAGMVVSSLRMGDHELLGQRNGLRAYAETGSSMGIPLLAPWANRLAGLAYSAGGHDVALDPRRSPLRFDDNGLPIHGLLTASDRWTGVERHGGEYGAGVSASLDLGAHDALLAAFPFPCRFDVAIELHARALRITTVLTNIGDAPVPVAFGWHPYLTLPGVDRDTWRLTLPVRRRAVLNPYGLPTGEHVAPGFVDGSLAGHEFDDLFDELTHPAVAHLRGGDWHLITRFETGYPCMQVFAPADQPFACIEPMTAPTNALATGAGLPWVAPGSAMQATFVVTLAGWPSA
jgi:galactose mutarotase-like enzyme